MSIYTDQDVNERKNMILQALRDANAGSLIVRETTGPIQSNGLTQEDFCRRFRCAPDQVQPLLQELVSSGDAAEFPAQGARNRLYVIAK